jgi:energy-coupling factor transporter ATP-binding protein EcfA2
VIAQTAVRFNPFPGLRSFEADEEHLFFGRERQVDDLLARLRRTRFLAVVGTSGSGKSSLVRSGLIPSLHGGFMVQAGSSWRVAVFRPGDDPIGNLAAALATPEVLGCDPEIADLHRTLIDTTLHRSARGLSESVRLARMPEHDNLLVLVDQFEELFRFKRSRRIKDAHEEAVAFVRLLLEAAHQSEVPVYVVLTMRSDFIGNCTELPGLAEAVNDGQFLVPRMTREERRAAITGPVAVGGAAISPRLVLRLLNDIGDDPDQLPILQHALMRTWDRWESDHAREEPLDLRHFEAAGTLREALSLHAEEAYRDLAGDRQRTIAAVLFKALTDRGADNRGVRRPTRVAEICELAGASEDEVIAVVDRFRLPGRSFLMPPLGTRLTGDTVLDISHESLMRIWERLMQWLDDEARSAQLYLSLSKSAAKFQEGVGGLWRDPELQLALNWRDETKPTALWAQRYDPAFERAMLFLDHSRRERDRYIEKRERNRRNQLRRARWMTVVFGACAIATLLFGLSAFTLKIKAENAAREALQSTEQAKKQRDWAVRSQRALEEQKNAAERLRQDADEHRRLAEDASRRAEDATLQAEAEEREALLQKQRADAERTQALTAREQAETAKLATEAQRAIAVKEKERAEASHAEANGLAMLQTARALALQSARLQQDQKQLGGLLALEAWRLHRRFGGAPDDAAQVTALHQALVRLDPAQDTVLRQPKDAVRALALAADGKTLAAGSDDGRLLLFDLGHHGSTPRDLGTAGDGVRALTADPAGRWLAAGSLDGELRLWDLRNPQSAPRLLPRGAAVNALAFGGGRLAVGTADGRVELLDPAAPEKAQGVLAGQPHRITALALAADGSLLAAGSAGGGVLVWDLRQSSAPPRLLGKDQDVRSLALRRDGGLLAAGTASGAILLWDPRAASPPSSLAGHTAAVTSLSFASGSGQLASASLDGSVRVWNPDRRESEPIILRDHGGWVWAVALSADGGRVVSGGADRTVRVRPTRAEPQAEALCGKVGRNLTRDEWAAHLPPGVPYEETCPHLEARLEE